METYAKILLIAMPFFLGLVLIEKLYGYLKYRDDFKPLDTISSLSSGYTNSLKDVLGLSFTVISYNWLVGKIAIFEIKDTYLVYFIAFMALDFAGYWVHRLAHEVNFFWNKHAIHHSSEEFNLGCALRQSISTFINIFTVFLIPAAIFGVPAMVIAVIAPIHLFAQFWYHTVYIGKMGFLEKIIVTPSHHRVHHAINPEYLDKNHGQIFIFWDKLFGTFQEELEHVKPVYGITRPAATWNPIKINFQHIGLLISDAWRAKNWKDKLKIWFMPTGWRPQGFEEKYPVEKIEDPYNFKKYNTILSPSALNWSWFQFFVTLIFLVILYYNIASLSLWQMISFGAFIFLNVYAYTEFMDKNPNAYYFEWLKNGIGLAIFLLTNFWDNLVMNLPALKFGLIAYFVLASIYTYYLVKAGQGKIQQSKTLEAYS
jgi:alkylglycerol monooxygenase